MNSETILNEQLSNENKLNHFNNSIINLNLFKKDIDIFIENLVNNYYNFKNEKLVLNQVLLLKKLSSTYINNLNLIFERLLNLKNENYDEENDDFKKLYENNYKITILIGNIPINVKEKISSKIYDILLIFSKDIDIISNKDLDLSNIILDANIEMEEEEISTSDGLFSMKSFVLIFVITVIIFIILGLSLGLNNRFNS
tara:strand:+ start:162 stop:758 length:597 start_codon:yes stop_codon:yes gene_type:complete